MKLFSGIDENTLQSLLLSAIGVLLLGFGTWVTGTVTKLNDRSTEDEKKIASLETAVYKIEAMIRDSNAENKERYREILKEIRILQEKVERANSRARTTKPE